VADTSLASIARRFDSSQCDMLCVLARFERMPIHVLNNTILWVESLLFLACFVFAANLDWMTVWAAIFRGKHSSWIPLVGGLFGVAGVWLLPIAGSHFYWWLPLILDWGSLPGLLSTAWSFASRKHRP
jgi:hypothetical protein